MKSGLLFLFGILMPFTFLRAQYIEEVNYDAPGTDAAGTEFIQVFLPSGSNAANFDIILINGATSTAGVVYKTINLSSGATNFTITSGAVTGGTLYTLNTTSADQIQNGSADGMILYDNANSAVVQAISYEGTVTVSSAATPAAIAGISLTDVGVAENNNAPDQSINYGNPWYNDTPNSSVLPVSLIDFSGKSAKEGVFLQWQTASEVNNDYFVIEKSMDGSSFETLEQITASNAANGQSYQWIDKNAKIGISYYRLLQVDFDGSRHYLNTIAVQHAKTASYEMRIDAQKQLTIAGLNTTASIAIYSIGGQLMFQSTLQEQGSVNLPNLVSGQYLVVAHINNEKLVQQLIW